MNRARVIDFLQNDPLFVLGEGVSSLQVTWYSFLSWNAYLIFWWSFFNRPVLIRGQSDVRVENKPLSLFFFSLPLGYEPYFISKSHREWGESQGWDRSQSASGRHNYESHVYHTYLSQKGLSITLSSVCHSSENLLVSWMICFSNVDFSLKVKKVILIYF